ncbi:hypothetical protein [Spirosoma fluviale]|uniref:DUF5723 domain-containing protein n=1 Tax=Spirosoma fluviale TaxID=1597977 RepID=A0A286FCY3_9BACT|nr:hypothetical protein [Spirosoma fluviale]SOD80956.1 hypothetical protein SAMN06269250_1624 [Spirosoma fluviale]
MKSFITLIIFFCVNLCFAQDKDSLTLKDLEIPNSPGFILLDQAPTSIERPNSVKAFTVGAFNSFGESNGFPKNYAIEITPFWFFKHGKNMSALKYIGIQNGKLTTALKTVSLSVAYVNKDDTLTNKPINNIAFGARTNLLKLYTSKQRKDIYDAYFRTVNHLKYVDSTLNAEGATVALKVIKPDEYKAIETRVLNLIAKKDSVSSIKKAVNLRPLIALDFAIAYNTVFFNNDFSTNRFGRFGTWLTLNYSQSLDKEDNEKNNYLNLYVVGRYLSDGTKKNNQDKYEIQNFFDIGGKFEFEFKKLSFGYEYISRANKEIKTHRSTGLIKYKVQDNLYITGAFGKNFGSTNNLVSLLGVNWGFSTGNEKLSKK